jgi:hypothetical protein
MMAITPSSHLSRCRGTEKIASFSQASNWISENVSGSRVMLDFKELTVSIDGYLLRSGEGAPHHVMGNSSVK